MTEERRSAAQRKADVLGKLAAPVADAWVATAAAEGEPYLVPLTLGWHDQRIIVATARRSPTGRNLIAYRKGRVALGGTRDVVLIDVVLDEVIEVGEAGPIGEAYAAQNDWDPRAAGDSYVFLALRLEKVQAWREENEIAGRTIMRDGVWLV